MTQATFNVLSGVLRTRLENDELTRAQYETQFAALTSKLGQPEHVVLDDCFFVFGEDLASALVGPFPDKASAEAHLQFCVRRGDGARMEVISGFIAQRLNPKSVNLRATPDEDKRCLID